MSGVRQAGKLGRREPFPRATHPRLSIDNYVDWDYRATLPAPTAHVSRLVPSWPMYLNDQLGDCTEAGKGHMIQALSAVGENREITVSDSTVEGWYERDGGYVPGDPSTDNGCVMQTVLQNWQQDDSAVCPITEFAELRNFYTIANVKLALYLFGSVYIGLNLPDSAQTQFNEGLPWTYVPGSPIDGGHAVAVQEIMPSGQLDVIHIVTWGALQPMNIAFWHNYVEEAWVVISPDWFNKSGVTTDGFNMAQLKADFAALA